MISPYQHLLDEIISEIMLYKSQLFRMSASSNAKQMEANVLGFIQLREYEILVSCDWNLNLWSGYDIYTILLKMSNENHDFTPLLMVVDTLALELIFLVTPHEAGEEKSFQMKEDSQSTVYFAAMKAVCEFVQWNNFYGSFRDVFTINENIGLDFNQIEAKADSLFYGCTELVNSKINEICLKLGIFQYATVKFNLHLQP